MMASRKKTRQITGIGRNPEESLVVQKSNPMTILARSDLSLSEFKILDMYLARIDTHKPEQRTVKLTKGQLEEALGITQIKKADLQQRLKSLYQPIDLAKDDKKRLHLISLFEEAEAEQDENGVWQITLTCTQTAMKYMFCIEKYGYFKYKLHSAVSLKSRYSLLLFLYLEKNRFRTPFEVSVAELKHELNCDDDELYKEFKMFNQRILKQCQKELHEKTECRFTYEPIRKGRSVASIRFTLETLPAIEVPEADSSQLTLFGSDGPDDQPDDQIAFLMDACPEFSREEMEQIFQVLAVMPDRKLPGKENIPIPTLAGQRYHYLLERYAAMNLADKKSPIKHRFSYFLSMVRKDAGLD